MEGQALYAVLPGIPELPFEMPVSCIRTVNEWVSWFAETSLGCLMGLGCLPTYSGEAAEAELWNCANQGLKGDQFFAFDAYRPIWHGMGDPL